MKRGFLLAVAAAALVAGATASGRAASPSRIVFSADRSPTVTGEIYRLDPDGRRVDLSKSPYQDTSPAVSPDGRRVAFLSDRSGRTSLYEVGIDGTGVVRVGLSLPPLSEDDCIPDLAWQPHGDTLAVGACGSTEGSLWIVQPDRKPLEVLTAKGAVQGTLWSPDGRMLVAGNGAGKVRAISPDGRTLWTRGGDGLWASWSQSGLLAMAADHGAAVYDEAGQLVFHFRLPTRSGPRFAWSPDGRDLAVFWSVERNELEVRTAAGKLVFEKAAPQGDMTWAGDSTVVFGVEGCLVCKTTDVNIRTRKESPASSRWLDPLSPDRKLAIVTPAEKTGTPFELGVGRPDGGPLDKYAQIGGCSGDGVWMPAAQSLQFVGRTRSLVYESWNDCDAPFANLYSIGPDGGGTPTRLTNVQAQETQPVLSPDGSEVAYVWAEAVGSNCKGCSDGIRVASADGAELRTLTDPQDCTFNDAPTWSPDGKTILYSEDGCDSPGELFTVPAGGGSPHDLGIAGQSPAWGPSRIAYVGSGQSDAGLWTANPNGSDRVLVAKHGVDPAWSADGRLAYLVGDLYHSALVVGSDRVRLPFARVTALGWTPDGTRLLVTASRTRIGPSDLYSLEPNGTVPVRLTKAFGVWSDYFGPGG